MVIASTVLLGVAFGVNASRIRVQHILSILIPLRILTSVGKSNFVKVERGWITLRVKWLVAYILLGGIVRLDF